MVARTRPDIVKKYEGLLGEEKTGLVSDYIFHCNGHTPAGETAFHRLMSGFGWANSPLLPRLDKLDPAGERHGCITCQKFLKSPTIENMLNRPPPPFKQLLEKEKSFSSTKEAFLCLLSRDLKCFWP